MLELKFLGKGSAFNTQLGNTSAYLKINNSLLLIDCGSLVFSKIIENIETLKDLKNVHIIVTHMHPDHIGSIGDLIFYMYYVLNLKVTIYFPKSDEIKKMLLVQGIKDELYNIITINSSIEISDMEIEVTPVLVSHVSEMHSYGYFFKHEYTNEHIYYSGDCNEPCDTAYQLLELNKLDRIYQDTCFNTYPNNPHLHIDKLYNYMQKSNKRHKVYCMHFDESYIFDSIKKYGFSHV